MTASIWNPDEIATPPVNADNTIKRQVFTATAGQTVFNLTAFSYTVATNSLFVYVNGAEQPITVSYLETSNTSITFITPCILGDDVSIVGMIGTTGAQAASDAAAAALVSQVAAASSASIASVAAINAAASAVIAGNYTLGYTSTSTTLQGLVLGVMVFTTQPAKLYVTGSFLIIASAATPSIFAVAQISSYNPTTGQLIVNVIYASDGSVKNDWSISLSGPPGLQGVAGTVPSQFYFSQGVI